MAAKKYSAGAIFLQVVPVFANVQRAIEREAKDIDRALGDQMEKSGDKAGERAGKAASKSMNRELAKGSGDFERSMNKSVDEINRALGGIDTKKLGNNLRKELSGVKRDLAALKDLDLTVDGDFRKFNEGVAVAEGRVRALRDNAKIVFRTDFDQALKGFAKVEAAKTAISDPVEIEVRVDTKPAERAMGHFERSIKQSMEKAAKSIDGSANASVQRLHKRLEALGKLNVGVDISAGRLHAEVEQIMRELQGLSKSNPEIDVRLDSGRAWAELQKWNAAVRTADGKTIHTKAEMDTKSAQRSLFALTRSGEDSANTFRSFNGVLLAAVAAGPALIPILGAIAGGLLAVGPAAAVAGAGLGSVLIGFSGIGDAITALQAREDQAAMTNQSAANREISSSHAVADARRAASRAIEGALDAQRAAQERYADSIQDVKDAEQALAEARAAAKSTGRDIKEQISDNALAQDQGLLDVFNATVTYNAVRADGSATNAEQEQARIEMERAKDALSDLRREGRELAKEQKKWRQEGVDGTDEVQSAQDRLNDALEAQQDAYEDLGDAAKAVDQARADGARQVRDAIQSQADAMDQLTSQQNNVAAAFDKMGLAGQEFSLFLFGLRDDFYAFRDDIQSVMLPSVQEAIEGFLGSESGSVLRALMIDLAAGFGQFVKALSASFQGPVWLEFFETLHDLGPDIQKAYGRAFISFLEAFAAILTIAAPFALEFAEGLAKLTGAFADWASSKEGREALERFMGYVEKVAPHVLEFFAAFGGALLNLLIALAPYGEQTLEMLTSILDYIANMDTDILGPIAAAVLALLTGSQVAYAVISALLAGGALLGSTLGAIIFAVVAVSLAFGYLMKTNEQFRNFMVDAWDRIGTAISEAWDEYLKPALSQFGDAINELWDQVLQPFFEWLGPILVEFFEWYFPMLGKVAGLALRGIAWAITEVLIPVLRFLGPVIEWLIMNVAVPYFRIMMKVWKHIIENMLWNWEHILEPTFHAIAAVAKWLWKNVLSPTFDDIEEGWGDLMSAMKWVWNHILKPVFDFITDTALPGLEGAFDNTVKAIGDIWEGLKRVVGAPIKFVLDTIINEGLIDGFNKVADWVGMDGFDHIPIPKSLQSYATGGVMPGYTPGRDVHRFVSPTAGMLELSGGEAVMRPEFTAAVGPNYVNQMNALARSQGVGGVRKALGMGGYWLGGVLPVPGAHTSSHGNSYGHPAYDINYGSGYDDYGRPIGAWKAGVVAQKNFIGDDSYGRWVVLNHAGNQSSLYAHMSRFADIAVGQAVRAGQTIGYVGDLGNTGTPPTSHLHFEIMGGNVDFGDNSAGGGGHDHPSLPGFIKTLLKNPVDTIKGWASSQFGKASDLVAASPIFDVVKNVPGELAGGFKDKVMGIVPGWAKAAAGVVGKIGDKAGDIASGLGSAAGSVGDALGLANGGILPYNGTMKYDNGGYLPPGMTTVVNLTGKPEPVFTNDQWSDIDGGTSDGRGGFTYAPTFNASDLTAEDVAGDLNFTFRRMKRGGKYEGVGS